MKNIYILLSLSLVFNSCSSDDGNAPLFQCDQSTEIVSDDEFNAITISNFGINAISIEQDCLTVTISDSGCDPNEWIMDLLGNDAVLESLPVQRDVKVKLFNNQACLAVFQKTISFDLTPLQIDNETEMVLNLEGWDTPIIYQY